MLSILLSNGAERAKKIIAEYEAPFASAADYLAYIDNLNCTGDRIEYGDNEAKIII